MIPRKTEARLIQLLNDREETNNVVLVEGARQVGKTTMVMNVLSRIKRSCKSFNLEEEKGLAERIDLCEDFSQFDELVRVEMGFRPGGNRILFIDEAQESRRLGGFVRFMKEKWKDTRVILSGSSMFRIFRDNVRYPVGRVTEMLVQPFSFEEFLKAAGQDALLKAIKNFSPKKCVAPNSHHRLLELLEQYLDAGGMPEVVTTFFKGGDWKRVREDILLGYYNDFKRVYGEERQAYFIAALKTASRLLGSPFMNSRVSEFLGGGKNREIIQSIGQLEAWKMMFKVEQRGVSSEQHFHPKYYLFDTGIAKHLREAAVPSISLVNTHDAMQRTAIGGSFENMVLNALLPSSREVSGWRKSSSGSEADFTVKRGSRTIPVECKAALSIKNTHLGGIRDFMRIYGIDLGIVISLAPYELREFPDGQRLVALPLYLVERIDEVIDSIPV